jgi:membrane associated rhomboid family serine protease
MALRLKYNAPVTLTYSLLCTIVLLADQLTGGWLIRSLFTIYPDFSLASPLSWLRLVSHVVGHASWAHLLGNFAFILLIGPVLEEKYGSLPILLMMLVTAAATGLLNIIVVHSGLLGASGIVFMLILLSSFTNIRSGEIPITFILIVVLYVVREFVNALTPSSISQVAHIVGGVCGGLFGFLFTPKTAAPKGEPPKAVPPGTAPKSLPPKAVTPPGPAPTKEHET